jgi:hypothetical protein
VGERGHRPVTDLSPAADLVTAPVTVARAALSGADT